MLESDQNWNLTLIQHSFLYEEAKIISVIPLTLIDREYQLVWAYTPNRIHSMKIAYHLHNTWFNSNQEKFSTGMGQQEIWKKSGALMWPMG